MNDLERCAREGMTKKASWENRIGAILCFAIIVMFGMILFGL